mgnify:CR=1 FL=1
MTMGPVFPNLVKIVKDIITGLGLTAYTDEQAQDAIGTSLVDSSTIDFTYDDATPFIGATVVPDSSTQRIEITKNSGAIIGIRKQLNFIEGSGVTLTITDDSGNNQIDIAALCAVIAGGTFGGFEARRLLLDYYDNLVTDGNGNALQDIP